MARGGPNRVFVSGVPQLGVPVRRFALIGFMMLSFFLILWGQLAPASQARARAALLSVLAPVVDMVRAPVNFMRSTSDGLRSYSDLQAEVELLRTQNSDLQQWQSAYERSEAENKQLREIVDFMEPFNLSYRLTRIVSDPGSAYKRSVLIEGGLAQGMSVGDSVVGQRGLLGRVVEVGAAYSRVMLITDINARVPVYIDQVRRAALVAGNNTAELNLRFLNQTVQRSLKRGDRVVTSGQGGLYPPGIPVGLVSKIDGQGVNILPLMQLDRLSLVQVVSTSRPRPSEDIR